MRQLTARLADMNSRLADELAEQKRLVADYDRVRETAQRAINVLHIIRDAETVLADTKDRLLAAIAQQDHQYPPSSAPVTDDTSNGSVRQISSTETDDALDLD